MYFKKFIDSNNHIRIALESLYGNDAIEFNYKRYQNIEEKYILMFGKQDYQFFSSPGRVELIGNHTDHNHGKVLAGSINMDSIAVAGVNGTSKIRIVSETYSQDIMIDCKNIPDINQSQGTEALVSGILKGFQSKGYLIGGINIYTTSNVISAAGVSSSASFEILLCKILDYFFNGDKLNSIEYSQIGKFSENLYWNKNSGLLDQMACALGGVVALDFKDLLNPKIAKLNIEFNDFGYKLLIINTGKNHADLSKEYSSIPSEMKKVSNYFNKESLEEICLTDIINNSAEIRKIAGDRAFLRSIHYFEENQRVVKAVDSLQLGEFDTFLQLINESGDSSWKYLQNCLINTREQPISAALAITKIFIQKIELGACRVHGGGFAGAIIAIIPCCYADQFSLYIESQLDSGSVHPISIRDKGVVHLEI